MGLLREGPRQREDRFVQQRVYPVCASHPMVLERLTTILGRVRWPWYRERSTSGSVDGVSCLAHGFLSARRRFGAVYPGLDRRLPLWAMTKLSHGQSAIDSPSGCH